MIRKSVHAIEEIETLMKDKVLENIHHSKKPNGKKNKAALALRVDINGEKIYLLSDRYKLFFTQGYTCICCGKVGSYFALEKHHEKDQSYHLNLYTSDNVLMTKDHILPKSKGGLNVLENYQLMCADCNVKKGNTTESTSEEPIDNYKWQCIVCGIKTNDSDSTCLGQANVCLTCFEKVPLVNLDFIRQVCKINYLVGQNRFGRNTRFKYRKKIKKVLDNLESL